MKHITTWHPDTCGCVIDYEWDDAIPHDQRVHTAVKTELCEAHKGIGSDKRLAHETVVDENQRKNKTLAKIQENFPDSVNEVTQPDGQVHKTFKPGHEPEWHFDENRKLIVKMPKFDAAKKQQLKYLVNPLEVEVL